jgi:putative ABC transport system permease protein
MSTFGLFVLAMSGILVVNLLTASMATQVRQIGIMKAIGASRWQLIKMYFGQAMLLGVCATLIAIPLGILGSRLLCRYMAVFLNFDINSFAVPLWVYTLVVLVGIVAPLVAAAYPVWKGTRVPVRVAISDQQIFLTNFGRTRSDRWLASFGGDYRPLLLSLRNSFRRQARMILTLLTLSAAGLFFMAAFNIRASLVNTLDRMFAARKFDLSVFFATPQPREKIEQAIRQTSGVSAFESWFVTEASFLEEAPTSRSKSELHDSESGEDRFTVIAIPTSSQVLGPELVSGRTLMPNEGDALVVNTALAAKSPLLKPGNSIKLRLEGEEKTWRIVGLVREEFSPSVAYVPLSAIEQKHPGVSNSLRLILAKSDADSIDAVKASLDQNLERRGLRARGSSSKADTRLGFDEHLVMIYIFLIVMSVIIGCVGGLGLMTTMSVNVLERRREMGILRAIGATPKMVGFIIVTEGLIVGLLSWIIAALAAWPVSKFVGDALVRLLFRDGLDFVFAPSGLVIWLLVSIGLGLIATALPAWTASKVTVREALAYE